MMGQSDIHEEGLRHDSNSGFGILSDQPQSPNPSPNPGTPTKEPFVNSRMNRIPTSPSSKLPIPPHLHARYTTISLWILRPPSYTRLLKPLRFSVSSIGRGEVGGIIFIAGVGSDKVADGSCDGSSTGDGGDSLGLDILNPLTLSPCDLFTSRQPLFDPCL